MKIKSLLGSALVFTAVALPISQANAALEEIIVTATRRAESVQTVPISITALSASKLEKAGLDGIRNIALITPGLQMAQNSTTWVPYIRGVGTQDTAGGSEAGVATYVDGVYMASPWAASLSFNNVERVEVLKGPQGTLFGRNASGGLIHIITRDPSHETEAYGKVGFGNYSTKIAQLYATTGISDNLAADIAINYRDQDTYSNNVAVGGPEIEGDNDVGFRSKWIYDNDNIKATFIADYQKHESGQGDNRSLTPGSNLLGLVPALPGFYDVQLNQETVAEVENSGISARFEIALENFDFSSHTSYRETSVFQQFDNDGSPLPIVDVVGYVEIETFTQEFKLSSNGSHSFDWIVGLFFMDDTNGYAQPQGLGLSGLAFSGFTAADSGVNLIHSIDTQSIAVFAETNFDLSERLRLTTGLRYTDDEKERTGVTEVVAGGMEVLSIPTAPASDSWGELTWRLGLEYDIADSVMGYATYNRGFRSGAFNTVDVSSSEPVEPEISDTFEIGFKGDFFDDRLRLNGALFYTDYQDLQVFLSLGTSTILQNAGSAEIFGLELEGEVVITDDFSLTFGMASLKSEYTDFASSDGCTDRVNGVTFSVTCSPEGNDLAYSPELTFNIGANYEKSITNGLFGLSLDYSWSDEYNWSFIGRLKQESLGLLNGQVYWKNPDDTFGVTLYGRNITDKEYASYSVAQGGLGVDHYSAAPPAMYGVEFNFKF